MSISQHLMETARATNATTQARSAEFILRAGSGAGEQTVTLQLRTLVIAGWAGRDPASMEAHIRELEEIGVARPRATPLFYRVGTNLLTAADRIEVAGTDSSGEVEPVIVHLDDGLWIGVGSDHTDRKLETVGVTLSKQACPKPVGVALWPLSELADHWDQLILRSYIAVDGERRLYQEGPVAALLRPEELVRRYRAEGNEFGPGSVMFGGTIPVHGGLRPSRKVDLELEDPVRKLSLRHSYTIDALPIVD